MTTAMQVPEELGEPVLDWGRLLHDHEHWLRRVILARTAESQAVDDVWQQVALVVHQQRWPLRDPAKVAPWLHRLVVVAAARYCRQQGRHRRALGRLADLRAADRSNGISTDPVRLLLLHERTTITRRALAELAPRDAEILLLKYGEQWSYAQIAQSLGITSRAVDNRLLRARGALRLALARLGIEGEES